MEEEFFLGDIEESEEFFLGDNNSPKIETIQKPQNQAEDYNELLSVYEALKIADHPRCEGDSVSLQDMFEEYFKNNPDIFIIAGSDYFKSLSESQFQSFETKCDKLIATAHKYWIGIENQNKLEEITVALNTLKTIFKYPAKTDLYSKEIRQILYAHLDAALQQKLKDKILEVSEVQELIEIAISIHLVSDTEKDRKAIYDWIKNAHEKIAFKIESYEETFIRIVSQKEKIERLNTDIIRSNLFKEYKNLAEINAQVLGGSKSPSDTELFEEMCKILSDNNILISNTDLFITDFFELEIQRKGEFYFTVPIPSEYFYYIKGTAINIYQLTEEQWHQLCAIRNIRLDTEFTVAFIMGPFKESSVSGIAKIIRENSDLAASRILAGDLETYFTHIQRKDLAIDIANLKETYKTNKYELAIKVAALLESETGAIVQNDTTNSEKVKTFDTLVFEKVPVEELIAFIIKNKSNESLIKEITTASDTTKKIETLLLSKKRRITYIKFLMNILYELAMENDISQFKNAFIKIALKIQKELIKNNDYITFTNVFAVLINYGLKRGAISNISELQDYAEYYDLMKSKTDEVFESLNNKNKEKSKFRIFNKKG